MDTIKNTIFELIKEALNSIFKTVIMEKKDEWTEELTDEINLTDSEWVKFRNTIYLSIIEKVTQENNNDN